MALNIPLPGKFGDAFQSGAQTGSDIMQQIVMNPYDKMAKKAQAEYHDAEGMKSRVLGNLINKYMGGDGAGGAGGGGAGGGADADSGMETAGWLAGMPEHPGLKAKRERETYAINKKLDQDLDMTNKITDHAYNLKNTQNSISHLKELINKNPNLTGPLKAIVAKYKLSNDKQLGDFISTAGKLQTEMAQLATGSKTGIGSLNLQGRIKPSEWNNAEFNLGMLNGLEDDIKGNYKTAAQHIGKHGTKLPDYEEFMGVKPEQAQPQQGGQQQAQMPPMPPAVQREFQAMLASIPPDLAAKAMNAVKNNKDPAQVMARTKQLMQKQAPSPMQQAQQQQQQMQPPQQKGVFE